MNHGSIPELIVILSTIGAVVAFVSTAIQTAAKKSRDQISHNHYWTMERHFEDRLYKSRLAQLVARDKDYESTKNIRK